MSVNPDVNHMYIWYWFGLIFGCREIWYDWLCENAHINRKTNWKWLSIHCVRVHSPSLYDSRKSFANCRVPSQNSLWFTHTYGVVIRHWITNHAINISSIQSKSGAKELSIHSWSLRSCLIEWKQHFQKAF